LAFKDYRDPLYGFIRINPYEQNIIDSPSFQRLRWINQLGTTFLVYPSANHTRFEHSLGTLEIATRLFDSLTNDRENLSILGWTGEKTEYYRKLLRYASLLHDIGHPPFSHASESLFLKNKDHESYTFALIIDPEVGFKIIDEDLGTGSQKKVAEIATGSAKGKDEAFLSELLTGDFGADRLDYLIRDSYHLGVSYGRFDAQRLLNTFLIRYNEEKMGPELAIEDGGVHSVEGFLLARYFMFLEVYYHKTRRILDAHLTALIQNILPGGRYPEEIDEFIQWNDNKAFHRFECYQGEKVFPRLFNRDHFRLAFETTDHPESDEIERFDWLSTALEDKYGKSNIYVDEASKAPYSYEKPLIFVLWRNTFQPLEKRSPLVKNLRKIQKMRIYGVREKRGEIKDFCEKFWQERERRRHD